MARRRWNDRARMFLVAGVVCILDGGGAVAQEVQITQYTGADERFLLADSGPGGIVRFAWETAGEFCVYDDVVTRSVDGRGTFLTGDTRVTTACNFVGPVDIAILASGSFLVVGVDGNGDGDGTGIFARAFDANGVPTGPEFLVNQNIVGWQGNPRATALTSGRYAVVWETTTGGAPSGRIVMEDGSMPLPERAMWENATTWAFYPVPTSTSTGGAFVVWRGDSMSTSRQELKVRMFDQDLSPMGSEVLVDSVLPPFSIGRPSLASGPNGFLLVWDAGNAGSSQSTDIFGRLVDLGGQLVGGTFMINSTLPGPQITPYVATNGNDRYVAAWQSAPQDGSSTGVYAHVLDEQGQFVGQEFRVNGTTYDAQGAEDIAPLPNGGFLATWFSLQDPDGSYGQFMRRYAFPTSLVIAPGPAPGNAPTVETRRPNGEQGSGSFFAYGASGYGANVGAGDIDGDSIAELLTGPGPSPAYGPQVKGFKPDGTSITKLNFYAYGTLRYGVRPAGANVDQDGYSEILTAPGAGAVFGPHIRGWDFDGGPLQSIGKISYFAFQTLKYGARVAGGDIDGDGMDEILTTPGPGPMFAAQVRGWNYDGVVLTSMAKVNFLAYGGPKYGATVSAADIESDGAGGYGDGYDEILVGMGPDPNYIPDVRIFDYDATSVANKYEIQPAYGTLYGCTVVGGDIDAGDAQEVVTAPGPDPAALARFIAWEWDPDIGINPDGARLQPLGPDDFTAFPGYDYGANAAVGTLE